MQGAEVLTKFTADSKDFDKKTAGVNKTLGAVAKGIKKAFEVSTVAIGATATAIGVLVKKSTDAYAEFEQLEGGLKSLFGDGSAEMNKILGQSEEAYKNLTMSQNEYLTAFQGAYPLVNAGLGKNADSIDYTNKMLQISSDLFNTYGGSVEQYQNAINWALKGSFVYLDNLNLGIKGTQEGFIEAANSSGVLGRKIKDVKELTSNEIIDVIQHYAEAYGVWGKTGTEASETISGSLNMTKATWNNLIAGFSKDGADMNKLIDNFVKSAMTFGKNLLPVIETALNSIAAALPTITDKVGEILPGLIQKLAPILITSAVNLINALIPKIPSLIKSLLPPIIDGFILIVKNIFGMVPTWLEAIVIPIMAFIGTFSMIMKIISIVKGITSAISVLNAVMLANPIVLIIAAIVALIAIFVVLWKKCDWFRNFWIGLWNGIVKIVVGAWEWIKGLFAGVIDFISNNWQALLLFLVNPFAGAFKLLYDNCEGFKNFVNGFVNAVVNFFKSIPGKLVSFAQGIVNVFTSIPGKMMNVGQNIAQGLWNGISGLKNWVINKVKGMGKAILNSIKNVLGIHSPSTEFAMIGKFSVLGYTEELDKMTKTVQGQIAETFSVSPQLANSSSLHYSPNVVVNTVNNISQDPLGRMVNDIKTFSGGAKNDYNYGMGV